MPENIRYSLHYNKKRTVWIAQVKRGDAKWTSKYLPLHVQKRSDADVWLQDWLAAGAPSKADIIRSRRARPRKEGFLYCVQLQNNDGYVKFGYTNSIDTRMSHLQTGCPYELKLVWSLPGDGKAESALHSKVEQFRVRNEWYFPAALDAVSAPAIVSHGSITPGPL